MIDIPDFVYAKDAQGNNLCPRCNHTVTACTCPSLKPIEKKQTKIRPKISLDKGGRKGKIVTIISGLPVNETYLKEKSKELKTKTGSGGTYYVSDDKVGVIEIQGDHRRTIMQFFIKVLIFIMCATTMAYADDVGSVISKMTKDLKLTTEQAAAIKPIITASLARRQEYMRNLQSEVVINKKAVRADLRAFRNEENQQLSQILTKEQMDALIQRQHLRDQFNSQQLDFNQNSFDGFTATPQGGSFQF